MMQPNSRIFNNISSAIRLNFKVTYSPLSQKQICTRNFHYARMPLIDVRVGRNRKINRPISAFLKPYNCSYTLITRSESTSVNIIEPPAAITSVASPSNNIHGAESSTVLSRSSETTSVTENTGILHNSPVTEKVEIADTLVESIPEPPVIPAESIEEFFTAATPLFEGEQSLASLGLAGWSPSGIAQQCLEFLHVTFGLPWWGAIFTGTLIVRLLLFPLVVKSQRNGARMTNNMPQIQLLQVKMTEARQSGNALMAAKYGNDMMLFMKEKDISPFKSMLVPLAMAPVFMSFFFGLRGMANLPVQSMMTGGMFWFTDLTLADPFYILPLVTSVTMWITLEIGVDGARLNSSPHGGLMKYFLRALPVIMFPFTMNFPAAILCYWVSTNAVSLVQVSFLKIPAVREKLNIELLRPIIAADLPVKKEGFVKTFKNSWTNIKISKQMEERELYDDISFKRAGRGPIPKTYKYDPTKAPKNVIQAKRK